MRTGNEHHTLAFLHWLRRLPSVTDMNQIQLVEWVERVVRDPGANVAPAWLREFEEFEAAEKARGR